MKDGTLAKVSIYAFLDKDLVIPNMAVPQPFYLPLNPESYAKNLKVETDNRRAQGNQGTDPRYISTAPEELKLDFMFDGTGAIESYKYTDTSDKTVKGQLKLFLKVVYDMVGAIHRPNFLKLHWGEHLVFPCVLSSLDLQYTLFEANGDPLRVKVSATFLKYQAEKERTLKMRTQSPDLTHLRKVDASDRLDLLTQKIYNDPKYLMQVARVNNLPTIRRLKPGDELRFPPLEKLGTV